MAWLKGRQKERMEFAADLLNKGLLAREGMMSEGEARYELYRFLRNNIAFTAELFLGIKLFPFQVMAIKGMMVADYSMMVFSRGLSKCSKFDELVFTNSGAKKIIDVEVGESIQSLHGQNKVLGKTINPAQKIWQIHTKSGYKSGGLDYHRTLVFNPDTLEYDWKFSKDIQAGEIIPIRKGFEFWPEENNDFFKDAKIDRNSKFKFDPTARSVEDWYYFFGLLIGDGFYIGGRGKKSGIGFVSADEEMAIWANDFVKDVCLENRSEPRKDSHGLFRIDVARNGLITWMRSLGFDPDKLAHEKKIPYSLLNNSKTNICALISGLYDTDGYFSIRENKKKNAVMSNVGFTSCSEELIQQVQNLLLNLGIASSTHITFKGGPSKFRDGKIYQCRKAWSIVVCNNSSCRLFTEKIGFKLSRKKDGLNAGLIKQTHGSMDYSSKIPCQKYIEKKYGRYHNQNGDMVKLSWGGTSLSRPKLQRLYNMGVFDEEDSPKIAEILSLDIYYDTVKEVANEETVTVDIEVENEHCYYSNGFINHNSFSCAVYILLECLLNPKGAQIGVISSTFRQAKLIFMKIEDIAAGANAELLREAGLKITKGTDMWTLTLGKGRAIALPLANGERLRGFRFNRIVLDEFLTIPEKIFADVITPFLSSASDPTERQELHEIESKLIEQGLMKESERYVWPSNKLIILSSPSYKFEYMYKLYKKYEALIFGDDLSQLGEQDPDDLSDSAYRFIMQLGYDCAPEKLYDGNLLKQAKATMSEMQFMREFGGQFVDESDGYYRLSKMSACTIPDGSLPAVEVMGNPADEYIISFDPNWAGNSSADHFAMQVFKIDRASQKGCLVHSYAIAGVDLKEHMFYFHYLITHFNVVGMCGDYNGAVQFIQACNESKLFQDSKIFINTIEVDFDKPEIYTEDLLEFKKQYNLKERRYCILRKPSSTWIREANEMLQAAIDHRRILFGARATDEHFDEQRKKNIPIEKLKWDLEQSKDKPAAMMLDFVDFQKQNIELTKSQCANIEVVSNPQGSQSFQLPQNLRRQSGPNRARKDSYSALVLGNWFMKIFFDANEAVAPVKPTSTFTPFVC